MAVGHFYSLFEQGSVRGSEEVVSISKVSNLHIVFVVTAALITAVISFKLSPPDVGFWIQMIFFLLLTVMADALAVEISKGNTVSVAFSVEMAIILLFGPFVAIILSVLGYVLTLFRFGLSRLDRMLYNIGQLALSSGISGLVFVLLGGQFVSFDSSSFVPFFAASATYMVVNIALFSKFISLEEGVSPWGIFLTNLKWIVPNLVALAPLGFLMAIIFQSWSYWGLIIFFLPLLLARHSFKLYMDMKEVYLNTIKSMVIAIEAKDPYTAGHSQRVSEYTVELAKEMKLSEDVIEELRYMALLHDVGKVGVQEAILNKGGQLTDDEYQKIQHHAVIGSDIVKEIKGLQEVYRAVRHHHERWDGGGYPEGLKGTEIPLGARLIAVADTFDAMTSNRIYRRGLEPEVAFSEMLRVAGTQLDPEMAAKFVEIYREKVRVEGIAAIKFQSVESGEIK